MNPAVAGFKTWISDNSDALRCSNVSVVQNTLNHLRTKALKSKIIYLPFVLKKFNMSCITDAF